MVFSLGKRFLGQQRKGVSRKASRIVGRFRRRLHRKVLVEIGKKDCRDDLMIDLRVLMVID